ncbi:MAG: hypothetical protein LBL46_03150 [Rickettsiales bacterium]|jgi:hypothetical protein|nr:hypothetical protein [Rickettsiales bacterium]
MKKRTDNREQRIDNGRKRIILFSVICSLFSLCGAAGAAKLCRKNAFAGVNSGAYSIANKIWAGGTGCGQTGFGNADGHKGSITDPAQLCGAGTRVVSGQMTCRPGTEWGYFGNDDINLTDASSGEVCWCRVTWPFASKWIPIITSKNGCKENCGIRCALQDYGLRTAFLGV